MKRIKIIGLALAAVFAITAVAAASASAFTTFKAAKYPVEVKASQIGTNIFEIGTSKVECTTAAFVGTATADASSIVVHPTYSGCTAFKFVGATVTTTGCNYELFASGKVSIVCETGKKIEIVAGSCTVKVGAQVGLEEVSYKDIAGPPKEIEVTNKVAKIAYESNKGTGCPPNNTEEAKYTGKEKAKGVEPGTSTAINIEVV
jgi:hypothetical protein